MKFSFPPESKPLEGYTIKRAIHRGGFGEVYYALSDAGKEVALKLLHTNLDVELRGVAQCLNLNHPNLVSIFDVREDREGDSWVIMEYVPGPSLDRMIEMNPGGMQLDDIEHWLSGIAAGLSFLHDRGIVHRDLKPANVYSDGKQIKLGDVGLSKFISESRRSAQTQSVGTVYYMAPEVAKGRYGREVDIYGLGIVLYEMLTGRVPFEGETTAEILMKHLSERPNLQAVPAPLRPLLARTLDKDPRNRPADANELAQGFAQVRLAVGDARLRSPDPVAEQKYARAFVQPTQRSNPAMEKTVLSDPNAEQIAVPQPNSLATEFQKMPAAVRWTMGGLLFLILMRSGMLSPALFQIVIQGAVLGGIAYGIYSVFSRATGRGKAVQPTQNAAAQLAAATPVRPGRPVADKSDPAVNQWIHREPAVPTPPTLKQQRAAKKRLVKTYSPETNRQAGFRQRMTELTGSMTIAILSTALLTGGLYLLTDFLKDPGAIALFGVTTLVASWAVLIPSKMVEGRPSDGYLRRLGFLGVGGVVGAAAFGLDQLLLMNLTSGELGPKPLFGAVGKHSLSSFGNQPTLAAYLVFFSLLFGLRRWWWHADSFRRSRFRISTSLVTLALGWVLTAFFAFPNMWGLMWALSISSVVQLSSTWIPHESRPSLVKAMADNGRLK